MGPPHAWARATPRTEAAASAAGIASQAASAISPGGLTQLDQAERAAGQDRAALPRDGHGGGPDGLARLPRYDVGRARPDRV